MILEFEKPIIEISKKIEELELLNKEKSDVNFDDEITKLYAVEKLKQTTYSKLDAWQKTTMARHPMRFGLSDFVESATSDVLGVPTIILARTDANAVQTYSLPM